MKRIALIPIALFIFAVIIAAGTVLGAEDGKSYFEKGNEFLGKSDYASALENYETALKIYEELGDKRGIGDCLTKMGTVFRKQGKPKEAMSHYERALALFEELDDDFKLLRLHMLIGFLHYERKNYEEALLSFERELKIEREMGLRKLEMLTLISIAGVYEATANYEKVIEYLDDALVIAGEIKDRGKEAVILRGIGGAYTGLSNHESALPYYERALKIYRELGDRKGEGYCLISIGSTKNNSETPLEAREIYTQALEIFREIGDPVGEGFSLAGIGFSYYLTGNKVKMSYYYARAMRVAKKNADTLEIARDPLVLGLLYAGKEDYRKAIKYLKPALKEGVKKDNINYIGFSAGYLGYSYMRLKDYEKAVDYYKIAIDALEKVRGEIGGEANRATYVKGKIDVYENIIWTLIKLKRYEEAFDYMERSRSRAFLDMLGTRNVTVGRESDRELIRREENLRSALTRLSGDEAAVSSGKDSPEVDSKEIRTRKISDVKKEYGDLIEEINLKNPELASLVSVNPMTLKEVQRLIPEGTRIVEFYTTVEQELFVFSVTRTEMKVRAVNLNRDELLEMVKGLKDSLITFDTEDFQERSKKLYTILMADVLKNADEEKLIIIPHGPLHYLPFSALYDGDEYLVDKYTIVVDPSASVLRFIVEKRKPPEGKILALGNPKTEYDPLPFAEREVGEIDDVMTDVDTYVRRGATETLGKERFSDYRVIHLACHGKFKGESPLSSALYLTGDGKNDGRLMVHELFGLNLENASLVVLSACETGLSQVMVGDELIGLSRGFIYAGTPSLVVTLWEVADNSTSLLMIKFYENLKAGMDKPTALRNAQLYLKSIERFSHPFYWAPFVIMGDWE